MDIALPPTEAIGSLHRQTEPAGTRPARPGAWRVAIARLRGRRRRARNAVRALNLALQGGGAHGAFTWGVLDRLLEDGRIRIDTLSGASAGAVNAVAVADGLARGGAAAACDTLEGVWRDIGSAMDPATARGGLFGLWSPLQAPDAMRQMALGMLTRVLSPYQFNPFDMNPLRDLLGRWIDFDRLRRASPVALVISATDVATGRARLFRAAEVTRDAVLASACLPQLFRAVEIDGRHYWDGGYSANPPLYPLIDGAARDTLIVRLAGDGGPRVPRDARGILARTQEVVFNQPLQREIDKIAAVRRAARSGPFRLGARRRVLGHRFHQIDAGDATAASRGINAVDAGWDDLLALREAGRDAASDWLARHFDDIGRRETADIGGGAA